MNTTTILSFLIASVITGYLIYKKAYPNNKLTCNHYILNSYLYILLSILLMVIFVILLSNHLSPSLYFIYGGGFGKFIIRIAVLIGILLFTLKTDPRNFIQKHFGWFALVFGLSLNMLPIYLAAKNSGIFLSTLFTTFTMVALISGMAFYKPEWISLGWGPILLSLLIIAIVMRIFMTFFMNPSTRLTSWQRMLSYGIVGLFTFILLYDTKKLQINAKNCKIPDYVNESINVFLDIINIFANLVTGRLRR
tara:strand:- start:3183 stop:3932 length:750 start_codon:yes stop_codon:yes gene_type:complete